MRTKGFLSFLVVIMMIGSAFTVIYGIQIDSGSSTTKINYSPATGSVTTQLNMQAVGNGSVQGVYDPVNQLSYIVNCNSNNVSVVNSFSGKTIGSINVGSQPSGISYVPFNNELYVDNKGSINISIIDPSTESVVKTISLPYAPFKSLYDPAANLLFVSSSSSSPNDLMIISMTNNTLVNNTFASFSFSGMAYDPYNCGVYIAGYSPNTNVELGCVYLITPRNLLNLSGYSATIAVGRDPRCMAFDPANKMLYVSDYDFNSVISGCPKEYNVTIIDTINNTVVKNLFTGSFPRGVAYDPANSYIYVSNKGSSNVSVINPVTNTIISSIPVPHSGTLCCPYSLFYDPVGQSMNIVLYDSTGDYLLSFNSFSGSLSSILPVVNEPNAVAYDPVNKFLYVVSDTSSSVYVYNSINGSLVKSISIAPGSRSLFACYNSHYNEVFLTAGCSSPPTFDLISINTTTNTISHTVPLSTYPNGMAYDSINNTMFIGVGYTIDVMNLSNNTVFKTISVGAPPCGLTYSPYTDQIYAGDEQGKCAIIIDANNYSYYVPYDVAGTHPTDALYDPYSNDIYITDYGGDNVSVINLANVDYSCPLGTAPYTNILVGTNPYSEMINPSNGLLYVDNGGSYNISVIDPLTNTVIGTFNISGYQSGSFMSYDPFSQSLWLPSSANYSLLDIAPSHLYGVSLHANIPGNKTMWSSYIVPCKTSDMALTENSTLNVDQNATYFLPNGTYYIAIKTTNPEFQERTTVFNVNGSSLNLTYYRYFYLNLNESGLPNGTSWSALINGSTYTSNKSILSVPLRYGQYTVNIPFSGSYEAYPSSFYASIGRQNSTQSVYFQSPALGNHGRVLSTTDACKALSFPGDSLLIKNGGSSSSSSLDPFNNILYLTQYGSNGSANIRMISTTSNLYVGSIKLPNDSRPNGSYFDSLNKMLYVVESCNSTIVVINTADNEIVLNITSINNICPNISGDGQFVFADSLTGNLFEINASSNSIYKNFNISLPCQLCSTPPVYSRGNVYVENFCNDSIIRFNLSTDSVTSYSVPAGNCPYLFIPGPGSEAFVPLYNITCACDNSVEIINETNGKNLGILPISEVFSGVYDPLNGNMYLSSSNSSDYGGLGEFAVVNTSTLQQVSTIPGTSNVYCSMVYDSNDQTIYATSVDNEVSVLVSQRYYNVTFNETGLPSGAVWYVNISGMASSGPVNKTSYSVYLTNGTYSYTIATPDKTYEPLPISSSVKVNGTSQTVNIKFTEVTYKVTFMETGLPSGIEWFVNLSNGMSFNSTTATISFYEPNGSYSYMVSTVTGFIAVTNASGTITINGSSMTVNVLFNEMFETTFTESGLPSGAVWYVNISGMPSSGPVNKTSYSVYLLNGTYSYTIATPDKTYEPLPISSSVKVNGTSQTVNIKFTEVTYKVTFNETGLPSGTKWILSSNVTGIADTTSSSYSFMLPNGTYNFSVISSLNTYSAQYSEYTLTVSGSNVIENITFTAVTFNVIITESGLGQGISWSVNISGKQYSATSGQNISVSLQNGTYSFAAYNVPGYTLNLTITTLTVNGHTLTITVNFVNNATVSSHVPPKSNSDLYIEIGAIVIVAVAAIAATLLIRKRKG